MSTLRDMIVIGIVLTVLWYIATNFGGWAIIGIFAIIAFVVIIFVLVRAPNTNSGDDGLWIKNLQGSRYIYEV